MNAKKPFWETRRLAEMTAEEWESLCDRCGRCCLQKLEDEETGDIYYTKVVCHLFDMDQCGCGAYQKRTELVPACLWVTPENAGRLKWMPETCAYRLLAEGRGLQWWHPLVSGNADTVHEAGISVQGRVISEVEVHPDDLENYIVDIDDIGFDEM